MWGRGERGQKNNFQCGELKKFRFFLKRIMSPGLCDFSSFDSITTGAVIKSILEGIALLNDVQK